MNYNFLIIGAVLYFLYKLTKYILKQQYLKTLEKIKNTRVIDEHPGFLNSIIHNTPITLALQSPSICRKIYSKNMTIPNNLEMGDLFGRWLGQCLGAVDTRSQAWRYLKIIFAPLFEANSEFVQELIVDFDKNIQRLHQLSTTTKQPIQIEEIVDDLPLKYILRLIFGNTFVSKYNKTFDMLKKDANTLMYESFHNKYAKYKFYRLLLLTKTNLTLGRFINTFGSILYAAGEETSVRDEGKYWQVYGSYLQHHDVISYEMFSQTLTEIIFANQDVVCPSISWLFVHYTLYSKHVESNKLSNFIEESARFQPVFPVSIPKTIATDHIFGSYIVKKGTNVCIDFINIGKCDEWKMDDLDTFRPSRYDDVEMKDFVNRFGFGGRRCPGSKLAINLFTHALDHLAKEWKFTPSGEPGIDKTKAFIVPLLDVFISPISRPREEKKEDIVEEEKKSFVVSEKESIHYYFTDPSKTGDAFLGVSVSKASPFLTDPTKVDKVVKFFSKCDHETVIFIVDEIAKHNLRAFENYSPTKSLIKALELGDALVSLFSDSVKKYGNDKIKICRWKDAFIFNMVDALKAYPTLHTRVTAVAENFLSKRGQGLISSSYQKKIGHVVDYIYSELPPMICGIKYNGKWYRTMYYAGTKEHLDKFVGNKSSLLTLMTDIITDNEFQDVKKCILETSKSDVCINKGFIGIDVS